MNNIENNFVPYQIALDMKELGFDEPCIKGFYNKEPIYTVVTAPVDFNNKKQLGELVSVPLFSQCFDWFREKYKLQCYPMLDTEDIYWCLYSDGIGSGYLMKGGDYGYDSENHLEFKTYKEAELECIKQLIEIVKNDNR